MKTFLKLSNASSERGASLGRPNFIAPDAPSNLKLRMSRLAFVDYDYDKGGAYWGGGGPEKVYCAWIGGNTGSVARVFVWARSRNIAKEKVRQIFSKREIEISFYQ